MQGRAGNQHEQQQRAQQAHVEVGQPGDALLDTRHHADGGHRHHHQHDRDQHLRCVRDVEQIDQAGLHHQRTDAEIGDHGDQRGEDAEAIDHVADAAMDAFTEDRIQRRAQCQRQVAAIGEIAQRHADQRVQRPAMQAPVQERQHHRLAAGRHRAARLARRIEEMVQRLVGTVVQQCDTDTRREQHRHPRDVAEGRRFLVVAQADTAIGRERQPQHESQAQHDQQHVPRAERSRDLGLRPLQPVLAGIGIEDGEQPENADRHRGAEEDKAVQAQGRALGVSLGRHGIVSSVRRSTWAGPDRETGPMAWGRERILGFID
jgi:hypothetical protein